MKTLFWFDNVKRRDDLGLRRKLEENIKTGFQKIVFVWVCVWFRMGSISGLLWMG